MEATVIDHTWKQSIINVRRDLHRHPEPGWAEFRTASIVADRLQSLGYDVKTGKDACCTESRLGVPDEKTLRKYEELALSSGAVPEWVERMAGGNTAVVGILRGERPGPVTALRFDMDALELAESTEIAHVPAAEGFASERTGLMHGCGHDGHTAIGLGLAELLAADREQIAGEVRLLFQPAEEGSRGAKAMVDAGWLDDVDFFYSGHIGISSLKLGEIAASTHGFLATSKLDVQYIGKPAHAGGKPEEGRNALLAAAACALHLNGITRHSKGATRINVGQLQAGSGRNIVADWAELKLETRGETSELNDYMLEEAVRIIEGSAVLYGVTPKWQLVGHGIDAACSPELIARVERAALQMDGVISFVPTMHFGASEDATYMLQRVIERGGLATFMLFGSPLKMWHHQAGFDFDEDVLPLAAELLFRLVKMGE